jgi:hypothetical protein
MEGKLSINPVAWSGDKVLKYHAAVVFEDRSIMSGDPKPTEEEAVKSLGDECKAWAERVKFVKAIVKKELNLQALR